MKFLLTLLSVCFLAFGCNNSDNSSHPYADILSRPPYKSVTDSIADAPRDADLYFRRGVLLNTNEQPAPALLDFLRAWELDKFETYAIAAANIYLTSRPDSAIPFLQQAIKELPESLFLQLLLARAYNNTGAADKALAVVNDILAIDSAQVNIIMLKADILEKKADLPAMTRALEQAHAILPDNREIGNRLAYQYAEMKDQRALSLANRLIATDTLDLDAGAYYVKGLYYLNTGQEKLAIAAFDTTISHDHRYLNAYLEKGKIQFNNKKYTEAFTTFRLLNTISPAFPDAWYWIGRCEEQAGDRKAARLSYQKAYELDKSFSEAKVAMESIPEKP